MTGIRINQHDMEIKEYNGQRVITFKDVDMVHERPEGTANKRFYDNKKHFIEGEDFYKLSHFDSLISEKRVLKIPNRGLIVLTESGYLMLVKSFTDNLAWEVQRQLVKSYFRVKEIETKPKGRLVVDIPENAEAQLAITDMKACLSAIDVSLNLINRYQSEETYKHIRYTLEHMTLELRRKTMDLIEVQPKLVQK